MKAVGVAAIVAALLAASSSAFAADKKERFIPSAERGHALAERLCRNCHLVDDKPGAAVPAGTPTFRGIANRTDQTSRRIMDVLIAPHAPMPDMQMSRDEMLDIIAYLDSLRSDKSGPPLLAPADKETKPKYPSAS